MRRASIVLGTALFLVACGSSDSGSGSGPALGSGRDARVVGGADAVASPDASAPTQAAVTLRLGVPRRTPAGARVFVMGDFQGRIPGDPDYEMTRVHPLGFELTLDLDIDETVRFRFNRGSADTIELGPAKAEMEDRTLTADQDKVLDLVVDTWGDTPAQLFSVVGNVPTLEVPGFLDGRRVWVYLPPGYNDDPDRRFPVLYMLDGQNLFDVETSFAGEWRVDNHCERLIPDGEMEPIIVVGIDNGSSERLNEYTPFIDGQNRGGGGDMHLQTIIDVLMPYIDDRYRTLTGSENTGFSGSSLGGLMSLYVAYEASETFGLIGAVSPSLWWADRGILDLVEQSDKPTVRMWTDMGGQESNDPEASRRALEDFDDLKALLLGQGFVEEADLQAVVAPFDQHNEASWAGRLPDILRFLFPPR